MAAILRNHGIIKGDIISIYSENRIEFVYIFLATIYLGATLGLTYTDYTDGNFFPHYFFQQIFFQNIISKKKKKFTEEYRNTVKILMPKIIFCSTSVIDKLEPLAKEYNVSKLIIFANESDRRDIISYHDFITSPRIITTTNFSIPSLNMNKTLAAIIRTSGTTSEPKSVQLSQTNLLYSVVEFL